jgi:hypothetical protein
MKKPDIEFLLALQWYYSVELAPGVTTRGQDHPGAGLTREALRRTEFAGRTCVDLGTQEGLFSVLLQRGGAATVEGQDRHPRKDQVAAIQKIYDAPFKFIAGGSIEEYGQSRIRRKCPPADLLLFSGILYHMFDPLVGLCRVRALAAHGGVVIVETAAVTRPDTQRPALYFNADNSLYPSSTYFLPTPAWLDAALRFAGLIPIDCHYFHHGGGARVGRICVPCRAGTPKELANPERRGWEREYIARDFSEFVDLTRLETKTEPVTYKDAAVTAARLSDGTVDVAKTVAEGEPRTVVARDVTLMLADRD